MNLTIKILCSKCSEEFTLKNVEHNNCIKASVANFEDCPHCGERNDYWLKIDWPDGYISTEKAEAELQEKLRQQRYDDIEYFGAYLVDNYESAFSGGEDEIRQVCSNVLSLLNAKIDD